jgi:O-antigen/teichoic acid export membrane protein
MDIPRTVARNVVWNWAGTAAEMVAGFVVAPHLVRSLGGEIYGLWILIASLTGYFGLLDLGVRGSAGRHIAFHRARKDLPGVNATLNTALAFLAGAAVLAILGTFGVRVFFIALFPQIHPEQVDQAEMALVIVGLNLALGLLCNAFDATLWAFQRFDLLNATDIPFVALRVALIFTCVGGGNDLVTLAAISIGITAGRGITKLVLCFWVEPKLALSGRLVSAEAFRQLFSFGIWQFLLTVSRLVTNYIGPAIIAARLGLGLVTPYAIASRLISYASSAIISATGVLTPLATSFHAEDKQDRQRRLFLEGSKYCAALALFFLTLFLLLGKPLLRLWMGPEWEGAYPLLVILAVGETVPMVQWVTQSMILGMGRPKPLAVLGLLELGIAISLAFFLLPVYGLPGICIAFAVPATICRGLLAMFFACHLVRVSLWDYWRHALLPSLIVALAAGLGLNLLVSWHVPNSWVQLVVYTATYMASFLTMGCLFLVGLGRLKFFPKPLITR